MEHLNLRSNLPELLQGDGELTSAALSADFFRPQPSLAHRSAVLRSSVIMKLSKKMSEVMDQSSRPTALNGVILKGWRSSKYSGFWIFLGFQMPWNTGVLISATFLGRTVLS